MVAWIFPGICILSSRKSISLYFSRGVFVFRSVRRFLCLFVRCYVVRIILFKCKCSEKRSFLHMSDHEEKGNAKSLICYIVISH